MRSRAHIKTHPLHPILVVFPIAFFSGALFFDLSGLFRNNDQFTITAYYLLGGGIAMALAAAIPGTIDFVHTVPPKSSAKKRASRHAVLNLSMVALFAASWLHRTLGDEPSVPLYLALESIGFILMLVAGWMGGTLVHRNQIGIDPRYAFSGKWKEEYLTVENGKVRLGALDDLKRDQMKLIHADGKRIVIGRTENGIFAFDDRCTHKGGSLAGGMMICGTVQCPWHGSQFDVATGSMKAGPATAGISTYKMENVNNIVYLMLDPAKSSR